MTQQTPQPVPSSTVPDNVLEATISWILDHGASGNPGDTVGDAMRIIGRLQGCMTASAAMRRGPPAAPATVVPLMPPASLRAVEAPATLAAEVAE